LLKENNDKNNITWNGKIASIDIPSGWDVNKGKCLSNFVPDVLISLTLPKLASLEFNGIHYLAGRFVPKKLLNEMNIKYFDYPDRNLFVKF
jgi:NAD(P)H-hydrate epimerase